MIFLILGHLSLILQGNALKITVQQGREREGEVEGSLPAVESTLSLKAAGAGVAIRSKMSTCGMETLAASTLINSVALWSLLLPLKLSLMK